MKWKRQEGGFLDALLASMAVSLIEPMPSSLIENVFEREVLRTGKVVMRAETIKQYEL